MARGRFKKPKPLSGRVNVNTTLPSPRPDLRRFTEYLAAQENRAKLLLSWHDLTEVVAAVDRAYNSASSVYSNLTPGLARIYITCHQHFFAAAAAIFRGNPLNAGAASRRAAEAARTALAIKGDPENAKRWLAYDERMCRWSARQEGKKPETLRIDYKALKGNVTADRLATVMGILSDDAVHFTPEMLSHLDFQPRKHGMEIYSEYLETDDSETTRHVRFLACVHVHILEALNECAEGRFLGNPAFVDAVEATRAAVKRLEGTSTRTDTSPDTELRPARLLRPRDWLVS